MHISIHAHLLNSDETIANILFSIPIGQIDKENSHIEDPRTGIDLKKGKKYQLSNVLGLYEIVITNCLDICLVKMVHIMNIAINIMYVICFLRIFIHIQSCFIIIAFRMLLLDKIYMGATYDLPIHK